MDFRTALRPVSRARAARARRSRALGLLLALALAGCAAPAPPRHEARVAEAMRDLEGDPAVEARAEEVAAAVAREQGEVAIDDVEIRVKNEYDDDYRLQLLARIPVPNPREIRAKRDLRRSDTELSLARLDETALRRRSELCFDSVEVATHAERARIYAAYAERQLALLELNEKWRRSGVRNRRVSTRFEITNRIKLARRMPGPAPLLESSGLKLPRVDAPAGRLDRSPERLRETLAAHSPSVSVHAAVSERYRALGARAESRRWPWLDFVDVGYEPVSTGDRGRELSTQVALHIPFGARASADGERYRALGRSEARERQRLVEEQSRRSRFALQEIDYFEANSAQWQELLELARTAEAVAEQALNAHVGDLSETARLFEEAHDARSAVLDARERAGMAGCSLQAMTGVAPSDWPRN